MQVVYIHARPHGHPLHDKYGKSVATDTIFRDFKIRWHDVEVSAVKRYLSWIICAFSFPKKKSYDVFYSDGLVYFLVIMRKLCLIKKTQKIIGLIDDETLYFLQTGRYSKLASFLIRYSINNYDGFICVGNFETDLIKKVFIKEKPVKTIFNGVDNNRIVKLSGLNPNFKSKKILFIGSILSENRAYYKGLKFLLESFEKMLVLDSELELNILGDITVELKNKYLATISETAKRKIFFRGNVNNIENYLSDTLFYLHCSNGESWGISVQEAMFSGVIPFVSDLTGVNEVVKVASTDLVFKAGDSEELLRKISCFLNMPIEAKQKLSNQCREVVKHYTSENAVLNFKEKFFELAKS